MAAVYPLRRLVVLLIRASILHIGAAATATALRDELTADGVIDQHGFDAGFAAARLTPGTNLIALFAALGHRLHGLAGALAAVTMGLAPAAGLSVLACAIYLRIGDNAGSRRVLAAAGAAVVSVVVWSALRFLWVPVRSHGLSAVGLAVTTMALYSSGAPPILLLLAAAVAGAMLFGARQE